MKILIKIVSIVLLVCLYFFASFSTPKEEELIQNFSFEKSILYYPKNLSLKNVREVHPQYEKISAWISSVGSSVGFLDYDNDNLFNDIIFIEPRLNKIFICPAEKESNRYLPFELKVNQLPFNDTMAMSGLLIHDFNNDGKSDIIVTFFGRSPIIFYRSNHGFEEKELMNFQNMNTATGTIADFDLDGNPDILFGNYFPNTSKLYDPTLKDKDQIMQHSMSMANNGEKNVLLLWRGVNSSNQAVFEEDTKWLTNIPMHNDWTLAVAAGDFNFDMKPDLYIANDFGPDKLLINQSNYKKIEFKLLKGKRKFTSLKSEILGNDSFKGMSAEFYDTNNDGLLDIFVSNIADNYALHESHFLYINNGNVKETKKGIAPFENKSEQYGLSRSSWGWDCKFGDFNNDKIAEAIQATGFVKGTKSRWPELQELATLNDEFLSNLSYWPKIQPGDDISGNSHLFFFSRDKKGHFYDISNKINLNENQISRGIAISDVDHDGKLDFAVSNQWEDSKFYKNTLENENNFIGLSLKFPVSEKIKNVIINPKNKKPSKFAIGAIAKIELEDGSKLIRFVDGGNGHSGRNSPEIHFGLGKTNLKNKIYKVDLFWRDSTGTVKKSQISLSKGWHTIYLPY